MRRWKGLLLRCSFSAAAVILCYQFQWRGLRWFMSQAMLLEIHFVGSSASRVSPEAIQWGQTVFSYDISCTFADVLCGSIPFLWSLSTGILDNIKTILIYAVCLFSLDIVRLAIADLVYSSTHTSWNYIDQPIAGICYFVIWLYLFRGYFPTSSAALTQESAEAGSF